MTSESLSKNSFEPVDWRSFLEETLPIAFFQWCPEEQVLSASDSLYEMLRLEKPADYKLPLDDFCQRLEVDLAHDSFSQGSEEVSPQTIAELFGTVASGKVVDTVAKLKLEAGRHIRLIMRSVKSGDQPLGLAIDISEQVERHEQINAQNELLGHVQQAGRVGAWSFDLASGEVTWSLELYEIWGRSPDTFDPTYEGFLDTIHADDRSYVNEVVSHHIEHAKSYEIDHRIVTPDGVTRYIHGVGRPMFDHSGTLVRYTGTAQDITREIDLEKARKSLQQTLRKTMQLEAVGTLAGGAAHDFNNALTVISAYTEELNDILADVNDEAAKTEATQCLNIIMEACQRASSVSYAMLNFSGRSQTNTQGRFQQFDLAKLTSSSIKLLARLLPGSIELELDIEDVAMPFEGHPGQMDQLLLNLVINAREAMPDGGNLCLRLSRLDDGGNPKSRLSIRDTGIGMPKDVIAQIFQPFYTTQQSRYAGLGLSVVKDLVKQHDGEIDITSEENVGTEVMIDLPLIRDSDALPPESKQSESSSGFILLAEDNDFVASIMQTTLKRAGHQVIHVDSGPSALEMYQQNARDLDLLICDIDLPGCSGLEVLKSIHEINPKLVKVAITGDHSRDVASEIPEGTKLINKPFTMAQLTEEVRDILN